MKIMVTGVNGFIGRQLAVRLISQGHDVSGLSFSQHTAPINGLTRYYQQDITQSFIIDEEFDCLVHLAAYNITHVGSQDRDIYTAVNVEGTRHVIQAMSFKKLIYLSTTKVYKNEGLPLRENSPLMPQAFYEKSKLKAEEICRELTRENELIILRSVNVIGWGQSPKAVLPVFFECAMAQKPLDIIYDPQTPLPYIYSKDLIEAIDMCMTHTNINGVFNIAHQSTVTLWDLAQAIIKMTGSTAVVKLADKMAPIIFSPVIVDRLQHALNWQAKTEIFQVLENYRHSYEAHYTKS